MTAPPGFADDLPVVLDGIHEALTEAQRQVRVLVDGIDGVLDHLPPAVVPGVRSAVADLQSGVEQHVATGRALLAEAGSPATLRAVATGWNTDVGAPASRLAAAATLNAIRVDDRWTGIAAETYRNTLPAQQLALVAVTATSDDIGATLHDLAGSIVSFWVAIGRACAALLVALASAAAAALSVIGVPAAIGLATAGLAACSGFIAETVSTHTEIVNGAAARSAELDRRLTNDTAFPVGAWPRSTTDISVDASITDGDDTDWHLR